MFSVWNLEKVTRLFVKAVVKVGRSRLDEKAVGQNVLLGRSIVVLMRSSSIKREIVMRRTHQLFYGHNNGNESAPS